MGINTQCLYRNSMCDRTDCHTPRRAIRLGRSFRTNDPVGIPEHLVPTNPCFCNRGDVIGALRVRCWLVRGNTHRLYPNVEITTGVPLGMGSSAYILPEVPTIGFVSGRMSSSEGVRATSTATGLILKDSYTRIE